MTKQIANTVSQNPDFREATAYIQSICHDYGLHGTILNYTSPTVPESDRNRHYLIAGYDGAISASSFTETFEPEKILRQQGRSEKFFYPHVWVYDLTENNNQMAVTQSLTEYCRMAEFVREIFETYKTPIPEVLRISEINQLSYAWNAMHDPNANTGLIDKAQKDLSTFFKREKEKGKQAWLRFYRSDRFPDDGSRLAKVLAFKKRDEQIVDMDLLLSGNDNIKKLEMQEYEFKIFRKLMSQLHPDVTYTIGEKEVVDHGILDQQYDTDTESSPFGRSVSDEEYGVIRKQQFATEGWKALENLNISYFEYRDVHFRAVDEPLIASVYSKVTLEYAKCDSMPDLMAHGAVHLKKIPSEDFMNFVSLAKSSHLRFYIDTEGIYSVPSLEHVNVIYNENQASLMDGITTRMMEDKITHSHMTPLSSLSSRLEKIQTTNQSNLISPRRDPIR